MVNIMINDVLVYPLKKICDERGMIMHMLRRSDPHFEDFGEIYFSRTYPNVVKGWHEHKVQTQFYCVIAGMIKLVLFDNRKKSPTQGRLLELFIGEHNYQLIKIPPGVINGYKVISPYSAIIANCATVPHDPNEMKRYDPHGDKVPYQWKRIDH